MQQKYEFEILYYDYIDKIARDILKNKMNIELNEIEPFNPNNNWIFWQWNELKWYIGEEMLKVIESGGARGYEIITELEKIKLNDITWAWQGDARAIEWVLNNNINRNSSIGWVVWNI